MSDEGLVSLEDDDGAPAAVGAVAEQIQEEKPPEETPEDTDEDKPAEVEAVEVAGQKYVPVSAVIEQRKQRQAADKALKDATDRLQQLESHYGQIAPYAEILKNNPQLLAPRQPDPVKADPAVDPDLVALAQYLDMYDPQTGQPDVKKAAGIRGILDKQAEAKAEAKIAPFQQQALQAKVNQNYHAAINAKTPDGQQVNRAVLDDLWRQAANEPGGMNTLADPRSVMALVLMASGAQQWTQGKAQPALNPPLVTEASGGNPRTRPALSRIEEKIAADKGISAAKWADNLKGFNRGGSNTLED